MKDYILLVAATILQAGTFAISKLYQKDSGSSFRDGLKFTVIGSIFTGLIFYVLMNDFKFEIRRQGDGSIVLTVKREI
jgi:hypothetical protein